MKLKSSLLPMVESRWMMARKQIIADVFKPVSLDLQQGGHVEYFLKGGRGSTKSSFISISIVLGIMQDDCANAIIYRRVANTIKDSVYEQMILQSIHWGLQRHSSAANRLSRLSALRLGSASYSGVQMIP